MKILHALTPFSCLLLLTGCVVLDRGDKITAVRRFPHVEQIPSVSIDAVQAKFVTHGREVPVEGDLSGEPVYTTPEKLCETFGNSGLFSSALRADAGADYSLTFKSETDAEERSIGRACLFIITAGLYPICEARTYQLTAYLKDNKTGVKKTVQLEETADYWVDTLLFPVGIVRKPSDIRSSIQKDLNDNMAIAVHDLIVKQRQVEAGSTAAAPRVVAPAPVAPLRPVVFAAAKPVTPRPAVLAPLAAAPAAPTPVEGVAPGPVTWPEIAVKGTFFSGGKTLVLLGDGVTLETGITAANGVRLLEATAEWIRVSYRGETRTYCRSGGLFRAGTDETNASSSQP